MSEQLAGHHGPCDWPVAAGCCSDIPDEADRTPEQQALYERIYAIGVETLWRASGRRYGLCETTVRPCPPDCDRRTYESAASLSGGLWQPYLMAGTWRNCLTGSCCEDSGCGCDAGCAEVRLPGPIQSVSQVVIDGVELAPSAYRVDDHQLLVRQDGACWPDYQNLRAPLGAAGTWSVTYEYGLPVGPMGQYALAIYLCELWKLCTGAKCRLPARVEGIFRQGINVDFSDDNLDLLSKGRIGLPEVDNWLAAVNPYGIHESAKVFSVDVRRPRVQTSPLGSP